MTETTTVRSSSAACQRVEVDDAVTVDTDACHPKAISRQPIARRQHALVLEGRRHDPVALTGITRSAGGALHREVVGLGAAAGEDDLGRLGAEHGRDLLAGLLQRRLGGPGGGVRARRVPERLRWNGRMAAAASGYIGVVAA